MALSIGLIGCDGGNGGPVVPPTKIIVGTVRDLTGPLAFYDRFAGGPAYRAFNKSINGGGGIFMSGYNATLPLEVIVRPYDFFTPGDLGTQTIASITVDKVHFMWGGPGTGTIYVQAPICDAYGMLLMTLEGGATDMMTVPGKLDSWANTFINLAFSNWYQIPVLYKALQDQGISYPKAYVLYIDNEHGQEYLNVTKQVFGAANVTAESHIAFGATQGDIDTIVNNAITALNTTGFDIFCAYTYDPDLGKCMIAFNSTAFDPPAIIMGPGANSGNYYLTYGAWMEGVSIFVVANSNTVIAENVTMPMQTMFDLIQAECWGGLGWNAYDPWGNPTIWAGLEIWAEAVKAVGHLNLGYVGLVRNVLASYSNSTPATTVIGDTWYYMLGGGLGGGVMDYQCMPGQIGQWQNNFTEVIGYTGITTDIPKYSATSTWWYPMSGNWSWLP